MKKPEDELLTTRGITSEVRADGEIVGHALLVDYDRGANYNRVRNETAYLPGASFLFESSPGSWHVWNTTISDRDGAALRMLALKCDPMHISVGYRRRRWTLRVGSKDRINASHGFEDDPEPYKNAPEPIAWWVNATDEPQSLPHLHFAAARFRDGGESTFDKICARAENRCDEFLGGEYRAEQYFTMTDRLKDEIKNGG